MLVGADQGACAFVHIHNVGEEREKHDEKKNSNVQLGRDHWDKRVISAI
jgi:hypothetical protein